MAQRAPNWKSGPGGLLDFLFFLSFIKPWFSKKNCRCGNVTTLSTKSWHLLSGRRSAQAIINFWIDFCFFWQLTDQASFCQPDHLPPTKDTDLSARMMAQYSSPSIYLLLSSSYKKGLTVHESSSDPPGEAAARVKEGHWTPKSWRQWRNWRREWSAIFLLSSMLIQATSTIHR